MEGKDTIQFNENVAGQDEEAVSADLSSDKSGDASQKLKVEIEDIKDKHLRLYAEFENYKKKAQKDKEETLIYCNESLLYDLLPVIDTLEMALTHSSEANTEAVQSLIKGVENTLREFKRVLEKAGLKAIDAAGKQFDPSYHHAMSQVETTDFEDNIIFEEYRKGYMLNNKVLRPSLVAVSKKAKISN